MIIGIAGPYSAPETAQREINFDTMNRVAALVYEKGHIPFIGVNMALPVVSRAKVEDRYEAVMDISLAVIDKCDALLVIGESKGVEREKQAILARGLPVYYSVDEIPLNTVTMENVNFPSDYQQVMPYLIVKNAAGFMDFMKYVFGAEEKMKHMRDEHLIAHAEITVGQSVIMFADATGPYELRCGGFFIYVADADGVYEKALAAGATSVMPMSDMPYGRSGGIADAYGNTWWITTHK